MQAIAFITTMLCIIVIIGFCFQRSTLPLSIFLVLAGIALSPFIHWPIIQMHPDIVLYIFLPLLLFEISTKTSLRDFRENIKPILFLSVGHVLFIATLIACVLVYAIPNIGWPLAFVIGAVLAPPDDVAIANIAEKVKMPTKVVSILEGEGMLNDAAALTLLKFALVAWMTHQFVLEKAALQFIGIMIGESLYGVFLGFTLGKLRLYIKDPMLFVTASLATPFIAFLPAEYLGGTGVISTVVTGFILGNYFAPRLSPQLRVLFYSVYPTMAFILQSFLFLLVGVNIDAIYHAVSSIPKADMAKFITLVTLSVVIGRFVWVYFGAGISTLWFYAKGKRRILPWQFSLVMSWAGIRGGISLAAALIVPNIPTQIDSLYSRDFVTFLTFSVIVVTLILQGLTLPWLIKKVKLVDYTNHEKYQERAVEYQARLKMIDSALFWLKQRLHQCPKQSCQAEDIQEGIAHYEKLRKKVQSKLESHQKNDGFLLESQDENSSFYQQTLEVERLTLLQMWEDNQISLRVRNNLLHELDLRYKTTLRLEVN